MPGLRSGPGLGGEIAVSTLDIAHRTVVRPPVTVGNVPTGVAMSPDGRRVYVADSRGASVSVIHF